MLKSSLAPSTRSRFSFLARHGLCPLHITAFSKLNKVNELQLHENIARGAVCTEEREERNTNERNCESVDWENVELLSRMVGVKKKTPLGLWRKKEETEN